MESTTKQKLTEKEIRFVVITGCGVGEVKLEEGGQKIQTSGYKINNY